MNKHLLNSLEWIGIFIFFQYWVQIGHRVANKVRASDDVRKRPKFSLIF